MAVLFYSVCVFVTLLSTLSVMGTVEECPPWFTLDNQTSPFPQCVCSDVMDYEIICDQRKQMSFLRLGYCAFKESTINDVVVAHCPYVFPEHLVAEGHIPLPNKSSELNQFICGNLNRDIGTPLCGRCTNGTGPSLYFFGSQCVSCSTVNVIYYILLRYLPTTILFVALIVFQINITSAPMAHYILFCNSVVLYTDSIAGWYANLLHTAAYKHVSIVGIFFLTLNAIWTLDFFYFASPPLCVSPQVEEIHIPFLDTLATLYPFILLLLTYVGIELHAHDCKAVVCLWRLLHKTCTRFRRTWDPNASMIQAFAALFFLSYTKFIVLMYEPLLISLVVNKENKVVSTVSYIDPTIYIFSHKHWYLLSLSLFILVFIILPPLLLLILFPTRLFKKLSRHLKPRRIISIQTFVDTFHGCCKDGTNGTQDYRAVSGYILAICALFPAMQIIVISLGHRMHSLPFAAFIIFYLSLTVMCALLRPYKNKMANISGMTLPALWASVIALWTVTITIRDILIVDIISYFLLSLPHCVFYGCIVCRLVKLLKQYCCKIRKMEESVDEQISGSGTITTGYSHLTELS